MSVEFKWGKSMKRLLILLLVLTATTSAVARDKRTKAKAGPYRFSSKASAQAVKNLIVEASLRDGYVLASDHEFEFRFSRPAQMPLYGAIFMASSACPGITTKQVWSYTLAETEGTTKVTVQPAWEYPDDYCQTQTHEVIWSQPEEMLAFQAMLDKAPASATQTATPAGRAPVQTAASSVATPIADRQKEDAGIDSATQPQGLAQNDAARRAQQHQDCLVLAKDNPSITCQ